MNKVRLSPALQALVPINAKNHVDDTELRTQSPHSERTDARSASVDEVSVGSQAGSSTAGLSRVTSGTNFTASAASSPSKSSRTTQAVAEQVVTTRDDVFELFEKDGPGSSMYIFTPKRVNSV